MPKAVVGPECQNGHMQSTSKKPAAILSMARQHRIKPSAVGGLILLVAALSCFAVLDTMTKRVTASVPLLMALWVLFLVQTVAAGAYVLLIRDRARLKTTHMGLHLTRGALMLTVQMLAFFSLHYLPVGEFTAMAMTTPLLVTLLASRFLGEHVSVFRLALVAGGLAGTLVIVRPGSNALGWAILLPLALVLVNTAFQLLASKMARTEDAITTLFYTCLTALVLTSLPLAWVWVPVSGIGLWLGLLFMGIAAAGGNLLFILALSRWVRMEKYLIIIINLLLCGDCLMTHCPKKILKHASI